MEEHRKLCNLVKNDLIHTATSLTKRRNQRQRQPTVASQRQIVLVDLCSGRGGDIFKWNNAKIDKVIAFDNHEDSVAEAIRRYKKVSKKIKTKISFLVGDVSTIELATVLNQRVQIVSCQFALHYFDLDILLKKVSENLVDGGYFIGVVPDGDVIDNMLTNNIVVDNVELERVCPNQYYINLSDSLDPTHTKQYFEFRNCRIKENMVRKDTLVRTANLYDLELCSISNLAGNHISKLYFSFVFQKVKQ